ncbi:DUF3124 domain-containing protein [Robertkochia solimangrovi]|uniref:DUF3124 domain-containing protein n=1 Tax=Robertkochia solimangrovi TaxID=2213046 RepID=UPI00117C7F49|nr:DUF3124 domain-containing protein [Robertkochia solimangrovi]TRZ45029.1 hypothetical protein DMZ48_04515 [Robertkochia solimangrovi]
MKRFLTLSILFLLIAGCKKEEPMHVYGKVNWEGRTLPYKLSDSLVSGTSYLSVYAEIYSETEHRLHKLTATISLRNTDPKDSIYLTKAVYFNTEGKLIHNYFDEPVFIRPMETLEIVIAEEEGAGGTGGNFLFDWKTDKTASEPLFECVMLSTYGQQGLSFTTQGKRVR